MKASRIDSPRDRIRIWPSTGAAEPISERRSSTEMIMMLATPMARRSVPYAQPEKEAVERSRRGRREHVGWLATSAS
jgi:hypothetical protein